MRRLLLVISTVTALAALVGCRVDGDVLITVNDDGSGLVTATAVLDADAAKSLGDVAAAVKLDDLKEAGWKIQRPSVDKSSGDVTLSATHTFASPEALAGLLDDIGGKPVADGSEPGTTSQSAVLSNTVLDVDDGFASTTYRFSTKVDLEGTVAQFSDPALTEALGGLPLGRTPKELDVAGVSAADVASLRIRVELPGSLSSTNGETTGSQSSWTFEPNSGDATSKVIKADSRASQQSTVVLLVVGSAALVAALVLLAVGVARRRS